VRNFNVAEVSSVVSVLEDAFEVVAVTFAVLQTKADALNARSELPKAEVCVCTERLEGGFKRFVPRKLKPDGLFEGAKQFHKF
jgi:hypothetical protein